MQAIVCWGYCSSFDDRRIERGSEVLPVEILVGSFLPWVKWGASSALCRLSIESRHSRRTAKVHGWHWKRAKQQKLRRHVAHLIQFKWNWIRWRTTTTTSYHQWQNLKQDLKNFSMNLFFLLALIKIELWRILFSSGLSMKNNIEWVVRKNVKNNKTIEIIRRCFYFSNNNYYAGKNMESLIFTA